jgi:pilus assembly protein CpaE
VAHKLCIHNLNDVNAKLVPGFTIVATTSMPHELLTALCALEVEAVLLDLDEANAIGTILKLVEVRPQLAVVGVTADADIQRVIGAQRAGCSQVTTRPLDADDLTAALHRALGHRGPSPAATRTIAVLGSVGGAGATTIATYLAVEIAQMMKESTALFDLDFECGGVADAFDLAPTYTIADLATAGTVDAALLEKACTVLPMGVHVFARPRTIQEAHATDESVVRNILQTAHRAFPYIVLDLPRYLSPITGAAIEQCTKLLLVLQLTVPSVKNARRIIEAVRAEGIPDDRIELVVNRYRKHANSCTTENVEDQLKRRVLATVPSDYKAVNSALDTGKPLMRKNLVRAAIRDMAARLTGHEQGAKRSAWLPKLGLGS